MGLIGSSPFWAWRTYKNSAVGQRFLTIPREVRTKSPLTAVQFAAWGGMFSVCDCTMVKIRGKEDPINSIASGAITGGLLAARSGAATMAMSAVLGGTILAMIEGVSFLMQRFIGGHQQQTQIMPDVLPA